MTLAQVVAEHIAEWRPLLKFASVKSLVFFTFWQSVFIAGLVKLGESVRAMLVAVSRVMCLARAHAEGLRINAGYIKSVGEYSADDISAGLQNFIICVEMLIFALVHKKVGQV